MGGAGSGAVNQFYNLNNAPARNRRRIRVGLAGRQ